MIHIKSTPDEVIHHINQMNLLLLSDKEKSHINQILALESLLKDTSIKGLIQEDLKDETWITDTQILINTCYNRIEKTVAIQNHIEECNNFIVYRYLESKCVASKLEISKQISGWIFNEVTKKEELVRWVSKKFLNVFEASSMPKSFMEFLKDTSKLEIDLKWLHKNRALFYSNNLFEDIDKSVKSSQLMRE